MRQQEIFGNAVWLSGCTEYEEESKTAYSPVADETRILDAFYVLRGKLYVGKVKKATLYVLGLGFFHCYVNGKRVGQDLYLPLNSEFELREEYPVQETLSGHRIYVPEYDIASLLEEGDNTIAIHFGGGWYTYEDKYTKPFGGPKTIWRVTGETEDRSFDMVSSEKDLIHSSFVKDYNLLFTETHDYLRGNPDMFLKEYDDSQWEHAVKTAPVDTDYQFTDCPADGVCEILSPIEIGRSRKGIIYDCGKNISGYPIIELHAQKGEGVQVLFSEELKEDGTLDMKHSYGQKLVIESEGTRRLDHPLFTWYGFRYFSIEGAASPTEVHVIHSRIASISAFETDNETLNWIHDAYLNTQLCNMHTGIPTDCPHLERRGYTGDGQLTCHAAMTMLDAQAFYRKWICDIADGQDIHTGHVQYVAPYIKNGGGPGGWGCAIIEVPYQYYRHYGDLSVLEKMYPAMLRYLDFLEAHSTGNVVTSDKKGEWCLGDWCTPEPVILPAPYVNNYFYIKSLKRMIEISGLLKKEDMIPEFERRISDRKKAMMSYYYNAWDGNFLGNRQGANAFAVDIGLGDARTYDNLVSYYRQTGHYDTGIFGTDILTRVLFEHGDGQLALELLLSEHQHSYHEMRRLGATAIWEYWPGSLRNRSHNHPMFGAIAAYFYEYLVGIKTMGYFSREEIEICPILSDRIHHLRGERKFSDGKVSVEYHRTASETQFCICLPLTRKGILRIGDTGYPLLGGENRFISDGGDSAARMPVTFLNI